MACEKKRLKSATGEREGKSFANLLHGALEVEVRLAELVGRRVLDLETLEGLGELRLDGSPVLPLHLRAKLGVGD
jgi:hypothetical protein